MVSLLHKFPHKAKSVMMHRGDIITGKKMNFWVFLFYFFPAALTHHTPVIKRRAAAAAAWSCAVFIRVSFYDVNWQNVNVWMFGFHVGL